MPNPLTNSGIRDNHKRGVVADFLKAKIHSGSRLSVVSAYFTIYAYDALREYLDQIDHLDFLFGEPRFIASLDPDKTEKKAFILDGNGLQLANRLEQKRVARDCAGWMRQKVDIRSIRHAQLLHGKMYHITNASVEEAILGSSNFTVRGLGLGAGNNNIELNLEVDSNRDRRDLKIWFDELWNDPALVEDVKAEVLQYLDQLYQNHAPEFIYFKTLFHVFENFLADQEKGGLLDQNIKIVDTGIWQALFEFQRDGVKGDLASDFITYRFFFGFSHFRNSEKFNLWPLFAKEILPFCASTGGQVPLDMWQKIQDGKPNPYRYSGYAGSDAYSNFTKNTEAFAAVLPGIVDAISTEAQRFYDGHFAAGDVSKITLKLGVTSQPAATGTNQQDFKFTIPVIEFGIQKDGQTVTRPQSHLNEAKMTQLALSVRFAASLVNLHESDLKLLVLDDLLVSLDMSNRMKVVEILLTNSFANYQKIILTHDLGFFREFRRTIGPSHPDWSFVRLVGDPATVITCQSEKTELQKAEGYLHGHNLDEAAICLRKAAEDMAKRYREWAEKKKLPPGEFFTLTENLRAARNKLLEKIPTQLYERVLNGTPVAHREHLIPAGDDDVDAIPGLDAADRGKLKSQRRNLRTLLKDENWNAMENANLIDEVLNTTERVLNPGAHGGDSPLYEHEVQKALDLIAKLEKCVS